MVAEVCFVLNGRALEEMFLCYGARIGYWRGKIEGVQDDLHVRPFLKAGTNFLDWSGLHGYHQTANLCAASCGKELGWEQAICRFALPLDIACCQSMALKRRQPRW